MNKRDMIGSSFAMVPQTDHPDRYGHSVAVVVKCCATCAARQAKAAVSREPKPREDSLRKFEGAMQRVNRGHDLTHCNGLKCPNHPARGDNPG